MRRGAPAPLVDHTSYRAEGERFTRAVLGNAQKPWVSERRRRTPARIRYRRHTTIDQDARGIAENERVRRLRAPVGEGEGHADGDSLSVDATDVARTGQTRERVEGREDRASVRRVGQIGRASCRERVFRTV